MSIRKWWKRRKMKKQGYQFYKAANWWMHNESRFAVHDSFLDKSYPPNSVVEGVWHSGWAWISPCPQNRDVLETILAAYYKEIGYVEPIIPLI